MNKKIIIGAGIGGFLIAALVGLYFYTKKSIQKIAAGIDDTFDMDDNVYEEKNEEINGQEVKITKTYPKDEKVITIKVSEPNKNNIIYGYIQPINIENEIAKWYKDHMFDGDEYGTD